MNFLLNKVKSEVNVLQIKGEYGEGKADVESRLSVNCRMCLNSKQIGTFL